MEDERIGIKERVLKAEESYIELESTMQNRNKEFELRFKELESEKLVVEEELRNLKESDKVSLFEQIMVEKHMAENKAEEWKRKFVKLVETVQKLYEIGGFRVGELKIDENLKLGLELANIKFPVGEKKPVSLSRGGLANHPIAGSPYITAPVKDYRSERNRDNVSSRRRVNKMLVFEGDGRKSTHLVDLSDSETDERCEKESDGNGTLEETSIGEEYEDEDVEACEVDANDLPVRKRKRVITSDSDNDDDDDNITIATFKNRKPQNHEMSDLVDAPITGENGSGGLKRQRRVSSRLRKQRVLEDISTSSVRNPTERLVGIPITGNAEDDETEEESERESESESLDGFIVDDDEPASEESDDIESGVPEEESDGEAGYADVISRLRRDKKKPGEQKWEYEADMLAAFGKDPELCMRAVCVLYRFQTEGEKASRSSFVSNGRGFSMADAERGTRIGHILTDGDPSGDLKRSVEELQNYEVEICRVLACRYSKQLFQIYNNREVPFFAAAPSP